MEVNSMERLTNKKSLENFNQMIEKFKDYIPSNTELIYNKLGKLEDIEEELDMPLDKAIDLLFKSIEHSDFYDCLTCTNVMHNERGCDGNCSHNRKFSRKEILELLELEEKFRGE